MIENLSTAMQTSFAPSSSPRRGGIRLPHHQQKPRPSSLSFEDAYLISMGGAPVYQQKDELYPPSDTALIRFDSDEDDDDDRADPMVSYSSLDGDFDIQGLELDDNDPKRDVVFSPDGDNEIGGPSDSILLGP
jgi:hypothetical protein